VQPLVQVSCTTTRDNNGNDGLRRVQIPAREILAGRVIETRYFVQVTMIELLVQRLERGLDVGKIHHPAQPCVHRAAHVEFDPERVPVHSRALVPGRYVWQPVRRLEREGLEYIHVAALGPSQLRLARQFRR
jgi:hypothetical protein